MSWRAGEGSFTSESVRRLYFDSILISLKGCIGNVSDRRVQSVERICGIMLIRSTSLLLAVGLFSFVGLGHAQSDAKTDTQSEAKPELITTASLDRLQHILQAMGFEVTREQDGPKADPYLIFRAEGYKVAATAPGPQYFMLLNVFTDQPKDELNLLNEWNLNNNLSRVALDSEKSLYIVTEIVVTGGVTRENIEAQIKEFRDSVARWARLVVEHQKQPTAAVQ